MKPISKLILFIAVGSILFFVSNWWENSQSRDDDAFIKLGGLSFHTSIDTGINEAKGLNKPIFLYFRSETCYWCKKFEEESLSNKSIMDILNTNFVIVSIDTFKQKNVAKTFGVRSTPFMIFFTKDGEEISRIPGYIPADEFLVKLKSVLDKG